jgi:hypothetical protein
MSAILPHPSPTQRQLPKLAEIAKSISSELGSIEGISNQELNHRAHSILRATFSDFAQIPSLQRRIYDVLGVMKALSKVQGFRNPIRGSESLQISDRIQSKKHELLKKRAMYKQYCWIINRNRGRPRPQNALFLPVMIVEIGRQVKGSVETSFDRRRLILKSSAFPRFIGSIEIVSKLREICEREYRNSVGKGLKVKTKREDGEKGERQLNSEIGIE